MSLFSIVSNILVKRIFMMKSDTSVLFKFKTVYMGLQKLLNNSFKTVISHFDVFLFLAGCGTNKTYCGQDGYLCNFMNFQIAADAEHIGTFDGRQSLWCGR
jgi:hypothetical protein